MANTAVLVTNKNAYRSIYPVLTLTLTADYEMPTNYAEEAGILLVDASGDDGNNTITYPSSQKGKVIIVKNTGTANSVIIKVTGQTGITIPFGFSATLVDNGTDFIVIGTIGKQS